MREGAPDASFWIELLIRLGRIALYWSIVAGVFWLVRYLHDRSQARISRWRQSLKGSQDTHRVVKLMTATEGKATTRPKAIGRNAPIFEVG